MTLYRQSDHVPVPFECFLPFLDEPVLLVACAHLLARKGNFVDLLDFCMNPFECDSFLGLLDCHTELDQALHLSCQKLVAHVRLIGNDLLAQGPRHLDSFVLKQDLCCP